MNRLAKGNRAELLAKVELTKEGYWVYRPPKTRFGDKDIFNRFDLVACKLNEIRFIQIKHKVDNVIKEYISEFTEFTHLPCEIWVRGYLQDNKPKWKKIKISYKDGEIIESTESICY